MEIRPGDKVLLPMDGQGSWRQIHDELATDFPGVEFMLLGTTTMTHALVYRAGPSDDVADGIRSALGALEQGRHNDAAGWLRGILSDAV